MDIYDILLDSTLDVAIRDGDLATGEATKQSQVLLLLTAKDEWKQHPQRGVDTAAWLEGAAASELAREVRSEFSADGMRVDSVKVDGTKLSVEASYE